MSLNCPTCNIDLSQRSVGGETVEHCATCSGSWFNPSALSTLLRTATTNDLMEPTPAEPTSSIQCPKCNIEVCATIYAHDSGIPILKCSRCKGVWLVAGQLKGIFDYRNRPHKTDGLGQAMAESYARSKTINGFAKLIQSRVISAIFAVVILAFASYTGAEISRILRIVAFLVFPMACIWFSDAMGNSTGTRMGLARPTITDSTPGIAVAIGGWILMFTVFGVLIYGMVGR